MRGKDMTSLVRSASFRTEVKDVVAMFVLPGALPSFRTGICCQPQNACIDGGFVDLGSLTPLSTLRDDTAVYAALQFSTESLLNTIRALVAGSTDPTRPEKAWRPGSISTTSTSICTR
jgi:hypothetical protein